MTRSHAIKFHINLVFLAISLFAMNLAFADVNVYKCVDSEGNLSLQDTACPRDSDQQILPMPTYKESTGGLRELELTNLSRYHEHYMLKKEYEYMIRNDIALENRLHKNQKDLENLRHKHAKEMFDRNYRHFWQYGYSNGGGSFGITYAPSSTTNSQTASPTQTASPNTNLQQNSLPFATGPVNNSSTNTGSISIGP